MSTPAPMPTGGGEMSGGGMSGPPSGGGDKPSSSPSPSPGGGGGNGPAGIVQALTTAIQKLVDYVKSATPGGPDQTKRNTPGADGDLQPGTESSPEMPALNTPDLTASAAPAPPPSGPKMGM